VTSYRDGFIPLFVAVTVAVATGLSTAAGIVPTYLPRGLIRRQKGTSDVGHWYVGYIVAPWIQWKSCLDPHSYPIVTLVPVYTCPIVVALGFTATTSTNKRLLQHRGQPHPPNILRSEVIPNPISLIRSVCGFRHVPFNFVLFNDHDYINAFHIPNMRRRFVPSRGASNSLLCAF
jgi:hypothetical protein